MHRKADPLDSPRNTEKFLHEVLAGLNSRPRRLPCKYFYDEQGSQLFEQICDLDEYYLTRTELAIMQRSAAEMGDRIGPRVMLVEYGSGSSIKTRILLDHLTDPIACVLVDLSCEHLQQTAARIASDYPAIEIIPVCQDFTGEIELPAARQRASRRVVYFPGSTVGNFEPQETRTLLAGIARLCGEKGGLLIGIDLQKDTATLEAAYNDRAGVTAEFNLNLLRRINRELGGDFNIERFAHRSIYNTDQHRIEMHLVSQSEQIVSIGQHKFQFAVGESICTEYSHKYSIGGFAELAAEAGFTLDKHWTDEDRLFAVLYLRQVA